MAPQTYTIQTLQTESGVSSRTLRHWIRQKLLPKPLGRGRAARYDERHLLRARVVQHLRSSDLSLSAIRARIASLGEQELLALVPSKRASTPDGVPVPPAAPSYPSVTWEVVPLMDGLALMVNPDRGGLLRRIADDIYRHYGTRG